MVRSIEAELTGPPGDSAVELVKCYLGSRSTPFTGSRFESLGGGGDAPDSRDRFTSDDLVAAALLDVPIRGAAALVLLDDEAGRWSQHLTRIPTDVTPATPEGRDQLLDPSSAANILWWEVRGLPKIGRTRAGKLLARKRPDLLPVYDSVIRKFIRRSTDAKVSWWEVVAEVFADPGRVELLTGIRRDAAAEQHLTVLRTLDVVLWMRYRSRSVDDPCAGVE